MHDLIALIRLRSIQFACILGAGDMMSQIAVAQAQNRRSNSVGTRHLNRLESITCGRWRTR